MFRKLFGIFVAVCLTVASSARADVVSDWNLIATQAIAASNHSSPSLVLDLAVMHIAMHDAVQSIDGRYKPYQSRFRSAGSTVAAAAAAAHAVLVNRFPSQSASLDATYATYLGTNDINSADPGIAAGERAAADIVALRATDGSFPATSTPFNGTVSTGLWRPTPTALATMVTPWLRNVTPFAVKSASQFRSPEPPALTSREYADAFNEVKMLGAATGGTRTAEQTDIALFWSDTTPLQWNRALRGIAAAYLDDVGESARLFALANMAAADAMITCWETKIYYNFWRPVTAIAEAANDGNPATEPDPNWRPLLNTPAYPDYSSGANDFTGAMTRTLELFFGTDDMAITLTSTAANLAADKRTRTFKSFSAVADEVVEARIMLGFHFRFADVAAREQGSRVAKWTFTHELKPLVEDNVERVEHVTIP